MNMGSYNCISPLNPKANQISFLADLLKIISEESRLKILCILRQGEECVCKIMEHVGLSQSLVSHHLKDLKDADIVIDDKRGLRVYYSLTNKGKEITNLIFDLIKKGVK